MPFSKIYLSSINGKIWKSLANKKYYNKKKNRIINSIPILVSNDVNVNTKLWGFRN